MNISKQEQRALHTLAQGGVILIERNGLRKVVAVNCVNRDGWYMNGFSVDLFRKLKKRRFIASRGGGPYRVTLHGLSSVRAQLDNR